MRDETYLSALAAIVDYHTAHPLAAVWGPGDTSSSDLSPVPAFGLIFGTIALVVSAGLALGGLLFAGLFDACGNYRVALLVGISLYAAAALLILLVRPAVPDVANTPVGAPPPENSRAGGSDPTS